MRTAPNRTQYKRLDSVRTWLRRNGAYMAAAVERLGEVRFTETTETACIRVAERDVTLLFNARFFAGLKTPELAAVLVHESMHFLMKHIERTARIRGEWERRLFLYAAEAVINDIIAKYYPRASLPGRPITGERLLGESVAELSVDQVVRRLRDQLQEVPALELKLIGMHETDDHNPLLQAEGVDTWSAGTDELVAGVLQRQGDMDAYGSSPMGRRRLFRRVRPVRSLSEFLREEIRASIRFHTSWSRSNRKAASVYPKIILPIYEQEPVRRNILMAVDTSGSISQKFLGCAISIAEAPLPGNCIKLITFDTVAYPYAAGADVAQGGGGTRIQAVEDYIQQQEEYPDCVFLFTDGYSPKTTVEFPERWTWILAPRGTSSAVPEGSRTVRFRREDIR